MAHQFILRENVLTDNILVLADKGKTFKGGYIGYIKEYSFLNAWQDKLSIKKFRSKDRLEKYLDKEYKDSDIDGYDLSDTSLE